MNGYIGFAIYINSAKLTEEVYVKKNQYITKHPAIRNAWQFLIDNSILWEDTFSPNYIAKRKSLAAAFFKTKLRSMMEIVKQTTLSQIKDW